MGKSEIINKLFSLQRFGIKPGLERTKFLLEYLGNPERKFKSIHIAGTNGKGTVASLLASILKEAGYRTALYTSPHIMEFNERIRINGEKIPDEHLINLASELLPISEQIDVTFFEITTAIAFKYFADNDCDIAIIETGMGGRFDSTNVINPILSIITSIGLDHQQYLGETLGKIASEKAGIIKNGSVCIIAEKRPELASLFNKIGQELGVKILFSDDFSRIIDLNYHNDFTYQLRFECLGNKYNISYNFGGGKASENIITAICAISVLQDILPIKENSIFEGIKNIQTNTGYRARIELLRKTPPIIIDVAHNPDAIKELVNTINKSRLQRDDWIILFGVMSDKDIEKMVNELRLISDEIILTQPKIDRACEIDRLQEFAIKSNFNKIKSIKNVNDAVKFALSVNRPLIITGSFYLVAETLEFLEVNDR